MKTCKQCGNEILITKYHNIRLYCSLKCQLLHKRISRRKHRACIVCDTDISQTRQVKHCPIHSYKPNHNPRFCQVCKIPLQGTRKFKFCENHTPQYRYIFRKCIKCGKELTGTRCRKFCSKCATHVPKQRFCKGCGEDITSIRSARRCQPCRDAHTLTIPKKKVMYNVKSHQKHPARHCRTVKNANLKARLKAMKKLGNKCEVEDASCKSRFEFHHRAFDGHLDPVRRLGSAAMAREIIRMKNPKSKYQLLCSSHHHRLDIAHRINQKQNLQD